MVNVKMQAARKHLDAVASGQPSEGPAQGALPQNFQTWFSKQGWKPRSHQIALLEKAAERKSSLLIAPTGAGKTLAGFLPSLVSLSNGSAAAKNRKGSRLHTLYVSPLKALAVDVQRNLVKPVEEMGLAVRCESRTGDTPVNRRQRQRTHPPEILFTTPEQVALLLAHEDAPYFFANLDTVILDELHALAPSKRGDLLALDLARLRKLAPRLLTLGLSATVAKPSELRAFLVGQPCPNDTVHLSDCVMADKGAEADITILEMDDPVPMGGHSARYAIDAVYEAIGAHKTTILFVNTRMQAELIFHELWRINDDGLEIALHHGSLDVAQRRKVEAAMASGGLRAVVATSTLDLGLDWGDVDLVINIGAPKGASRLMQRIGRANHRLDEPSKAILVPANRFEVLECRAALEAADAGTHDTSTLRAGGLDVLAQHVLGMACQRPFQTDDFFQEVRSAIPFAHLTRETFDRVIAFVATGGYALQSYDRFAKLRQMDNGAWCLAHQKFARQYRMNAGTIMDAPMLKVRLSRAGRRKAGTTQAPRIGGRILGEVEESFVDLLSPGDTFAFAGEILRFERLSETDAIVTRAHDANPKIPSYAGGKFPLSTHLATRVRRMLADETNWSKLPAPVHEWLTLQKRYSSIPEQTEVLIETFPRADKHYLVVYPFEGRLAHQTLGMLLTRRLQRAGARPLGFVANDYGIAVWAIKDMSTMIAQQRLKLDALFDQDMLGDDLDAWLADASLMKRTFRNVAVISGLIERRHPGKEKTGRQVTISTDLIYDVLRKHDKGHILLEAAWADAATGLLDIGRLGDFLGRLKGRIRHQALNRVSPLSIPMMLEIGREPVAGRHRDDLLHDASDLLMAEAAASQHKQDLQSGP